MFFLLLRHWTDTSTLREPRWKPHIGVKLSPPSPSLLLYWKYFQATHNVTMPLIIDDYMISNAFSSLNIADCVCMWLMLRLAVCKIFKRTSPLPVEDLYTGYCSHGYNNTQKYQWWPLCWIWKIFALLPLDWAKPVILSSSVLDSSVGFMLHVWDCLMWEHCPLLIPFCTLSEASTSQADWHKTCGTGWLKCYRAIALSFWRPRSPLMSQLWCCFHASFICSSTCIMFWMCCWYATGRATQKWWEKKITQTKAV